MTKKTKEQLVEEVKVLTTELETLQAEAADVATLKASNAQALKDLKVVRGQLTKATKSNEVCKLAIASCETTIEELSLVIDNKNQEITALQEEIRSNTKEILECKEECTSQPCEPETNGVVEFWSNVIRPSVARNFLQCLKAWLDTVQQLKGKSTYYTLLALVLTVSAFTSGLAVYGFVTLLNIETVLTFRAISIALYSIVFAVHVYAIGYLTGFWSSISNRLKK